MNGAAISPFVGRENELAIVRRQLGHLVGGTGGILSLVGEAGIGKSRLVREGLSGPEMAGVRLLVARSLSVGQTLSFHPFTDLLRGWAGIAGGADEAEALAQLDAAVRSLCGDDADDMVPFIASLMGLTSTGAHEERLRGIEGEALERLTIRSMRGLFQRLAEDQPLLVLFEDLHWADRSSLRLLETLLRLVAECPILFIHAFRPEHRDTGQHMLQLARTQYPLQHRLIELQPLGEAQCAQMVAHLLRDDEGTNDVAAIIASRAEGSPFFVEEALRSLIDEGAIVVADDGARTTRQIEALSMPGSVREVIAGRLERLDPLARSVLDVGAVIGRGFFGRILDTVLADEIELPAVLSDLKDRGILSERRTRRTAAHARRSFVSEVEYVFVHALVQETIYEAIDRPRRRELHERVAAAVEAIFAARIGDFHGMLAYHYVRAENLAKAEEYLFKAGEEAARAAASSEALTFFREASRIYLRLHGEGGDATKRALLERNIGQALMNTGRLSEAMGHFDASLTHLGDPPPRSTAVAALRCAGELASIFARLYLPAWFAGGRRDGRYRDHILALYPRIKAQSTSDPTRLVFDYTRAVHLLNHTDPAAVPEQVIGLYSGFAAMFAYSGISFRIGRRYLDLADQLRRPGHAKDLFDHDCLVCICNYLEGRWDDDAGTVPADVVRQALRYGGLWEVNTYLGLDADRRLRRGDFAGARGRLDELADIAETYGFEFARTNHAAETTLLLLEEGRLEEARDAADLYASVVDDPPLRVLALGSKTKAQALLGDIEGAGRTLAAAERIVANAPVIPPWHLSAYAVGRLHHDIAALVAAPESERDALGVRARRSARAAGSVAARCAVQRGEIFRLTALLHNALNDARSAATWATKAIAECERLGALPELARTHADVAAWNIDIGDGRDSAAHRARATELFTTLGLTDPRHDKASSRRAA